MESGIRKMNRELRPNIPQVSGESNPRRYGIVYGLVRRSSEGLWVKGKQWSKVKVRCVELLSSPILQDGFFDQHRRLRRCGRGQGSEIRA